ncbi:MAG TPA: efflux RND transporter periplasmic adaptor subunit [Vicinamibacterales bacterium]
MVGVSVAAAVAATTACTRTEAKPETGEAAGRGRGQESAVPVVTAKAEVKTVPVTLAAVGTVEAISTVEIRAQVTGELQQILFAPGQDVRKGQPLFVLDPRPLEAALRQAEAVLARDTAQSKDATLERQRLRDLLNRGLIPRQQFDTQAATAAALDATLAADQAQVDQAKLNLQYARIDAPIDGRAGALQAHVGDLVRANDTNALVKINQMAPIYVSFSVPARFLIDIRHFSEHHPLTVTASGQPAPAARSVQTPAAPSAPPSEADSADRVRPAAEPHAQGSVTFIDNAVDPTTATINLKATFANQNRDLWPGLFVQVSLQLSSQPDAVVVPAVAVQTSQQGEYVYVVKSDQTVEMRKIALDRQLGDEAIVASGLRGGEEVVTQGQLRLTPGAHVTKTAPPAETAS